MSGLFFQHQERCKEIQMDEVGFQTFSEPVTAIGTKDLRSCSVMLVASPTGAILAHIPPRGDDYAIQMMTQFCNLYQAKKTAHFSATNQTWVVMGMIEQDGQFSMPLEDQKKIIDSKLDGIGLANRGDATYRFQLRLAASSPTFPGKGTVFVDGIGPKPIIYVEDRAVTLH